MSATTRIFPRTLSQADRQVIVGGMVRQGASEALTRIDGHVASDLPVWRRCSLSR